MVELQIISKILATHDFSLIEDHYITEDFFAGTGYEEEIKFIFDHYKKYKNVPDEATFLSRFPEIELVQVTETDGYLVDTLREEYLYRRSVPVVQQVAKLLKTDSNAAAMYMAQAMRDLTPDCGVTGVNLITDASQRLDNYKEKLTHQEDFYLTTGFPELDDIIHGIQRGEELIVLLARTNQGKSWVLEKMVTHCWQLGCNVGYISPEMTADSIGYRFDTLYKNYSNKDLMWGKEGVDLDEYSTYIKELQQKQNKFIVATPADFDRQMTVSKLQTFVKQYQLDLLAIDGITYITDERGRRQDNKTTQLTNISEDLMLLSTELKIPVLVVVQANRTGAMEEDSSGTPSLESIRDSDGIAHNASKVISIRQGKDGILEMGIKKQRFGVVGGKLKYNWDINTGVFTFIPSYDDAQPREKTEKQVKTQRKEIDQTDIF